ncbi:RNA polymerase sigma factor [Luteolibacter marinus]|uniref:RNA polymerase sigma factor n=1 Tax=Luteolibacter marinus TaxID=2776705 RepID=UPI00186707CC|nr:sigma-70 family RNA polymerase sigma factor [Luteolibacter marinus]
MEDPAQDWNDWLAGNAGRFLLFARQQTRCESDAEDVLQDSLVESWRRAGGRPDAALVFATIRRRAIDLGRSNDRRTVREQESGELLCAPAGDRETAEMLSHELRRLPPEQRDVLTLKFWGGLTFAEVATTLEIPPGTAASRYRLALESLRETLALSLP